MRSRKVVLLILAGSLLLNITLAFYSYAQRTSADATMILSLETRVKLLQAEQNAHRQQQLAEMAQAEAEQARMACEAQLARK